jgi:hypothetical protein
VLLHARLRGGVADVVADVGPVGHRLVPSPGAERVGQGEHVRVRPHARVAEQVPGAADGVAGLQDRVGGLGVGLLQPARGADAGEAGPDDDHVEVLGVVRCGALRHGTSWKLPPVNLLRVCTARALAGSARRPVGSPGGRHGTAGRPARRRDRAGGGGPRSRRASSRTWAPA